MRLPVLALGAGLLVCGISPKGADAQLECEACHGELELLRQHAPSLEEARALNISRAAIAASAHEGTACSGCHSGYARFPHAGTRSTRECGSCHEEEATVWAEGIHGEDGNALCADCHGVHDVRPVAELESRGGARSMRQACANCHFEPRIPPEDPHADSISCSGCHEPHRTLPAADPRAAVHAANQANACGRCHERVRETAAADVHAMAVAELTVSSDRPSGGAATEPPSCSACHGAHGMSQPMSAEGKRAIAARCAECHEHYAESFADSYHGQATELGSIVAATCDDCHAPHAVYPASDERSSVASGRVLATCQSCHPAATAGFAQFQPHADHHDREKYPYVYWSYRLMTGLLVGTFGFFGLHSVLWLGRSGLERLAPRGERDADRDA